AQDLLFPADERMPHGERAGYPAPLSPRTGLLCISFLVPKPDKVLQRWSKVVMALERTVSRPLGRRSFGAQPQPPPIALKIPLPANHFRPPLQNLAELGNEGGQRGRTTGTTADDGNDGDEGKDRQRAGHPAQPEELHLPLLHGLTRTPRKSRSLSFVRYGVRSGTHRPQQTE